MRGRATFRRVLPGEGVLAVDQPAGRLVDNQLYLRADRQRQIRDLVAGREIHQDRDVQVREEVEQEVLELVLLGPVECQLAEYNSAHMAQQAGGAEVHESLV